MARPELPKTNTKNVAEIARDQAAQLNVDPLDLVRVLSKILGAVNLTDEELAKTRVMGGQALASKGRQNDYAESLQRQQSIHDHHTELTGVASSQRRIVQALAETTLLLESQCADVTVQISAGMLEAETSGTLSLVAETQVEPAA